MSLSPWRADFGDAQGRVTPTGWLAPEGTHVFVLGHDRPSVTRLFGIGDYIEIAQSMTPPAGSTYLRATLRLRSPAEMPLGTQWRLTMSIDGTPVVSFDLLPNRTRDRADMGFSVAGLSGGDHAFAFRLTLAGSGSAPFYEVELPGVYVDAVLFDTSVRTAPALINRDAEPGETKVRVDTNVSVDITDPTSGGGISLADTSVYIADVLAFQGGAFQTGFTGPNSAQSSPQSDTVRIVVDPIQPFVGLTTVPVRVVSKSTLDGAVIDRTYSFTTEDLEPPALLAASPTGDLTITLDFSQPVMQVDPTASNDALNPANYTIEHVKPTDGFEVAVALNVASVRSLSSSSVELTVDMDMTGGATYALTAANLEDLVGNSIGVPTDTATFVGFKCDVPDGRDFQLIDMLPVANLDDDETQDLAKFVAIYQELTDLMLCDVDGFPDILDPDIAPEKFVDLMLADMGNPFGFVLSEIDKRRLVQLLVPIYKSKGTDPGIINAIRLFMNIETTITVPAFSGIGLGEALLGTTWLLGSSIASDIYTFIVNVPFALTDEQRATMIGIVDYMKVAHTHFKIAEPPAAPEIPDHLELGLSQLNLNWMLH